MKRTMPSGEYQKVFGVPSLLSSQDRRCPAASSSVGMQGEVQLPQI